MDLNCALAFQVNVMQPSSVGFLEKEVRNNKKMTLLTDHACKGFTVQKQPNIHKVLVNESCKDTMLHLIC